MQAMIFAAGMGTRLKPLTDVIPKALVPIGNKPLLQIVAEKFRASGIDHLVVNVHHKAGQIVNFLSLLQSLYADLTISVSDESEQLLETGGGIRKATPLFRPDEPVLIHNVDILSNIDLSDFCSRLGDADALLLVSERKTQRYLLFSQDMRLVGWTNIATGEVRSPYPDLDVAKCRMYAFAGIHVIGQHLIADMQEWPERFPIIDFYLQMCSQRDIRGSLSTHLQLLDVGKLDTLSQAENYLNI